MTIATTDNITKSHTFTAQNWLRNVRHIMCLLLVLPLIACGSGGTDGMGPGGTGTGTGTDGTGPSNNVVLDQSFVDYLEEGDLTLNNFLKTDTGKAVGEDDHLRRDFGAAYWNSSITDLAIEAGTEANTIKITVKKETGSYGGRVQSMGPVETLSYTDPDPNDDGRFELKKGTDEWGQGLFSSNSDGSTVMGLVSQVAFPPNSEAALAVTGKEYVWYDIAKQSGMYTFGGKALTTAVGYNRVFTKSPNSLVTDQDKDVHFTMTLNIPTAEQAKTKSLPADADAILSITDWYLNKDINAEKKNYLPLPAAVSLKEGVGSNNLRLVKGDGTNYIDDRFLNFGTINDASDRQAGNRNGRRFNESEAKTDFYKEIFTSLITARLYGEPGSLANNKAVIAGTYYVNIGINSNIVPTSWGVYVLKQQ